MKKKLTIKGIAEMAGVSSATVSKVLNNTGRYSEETKQTILDLVKEHDYRPNAVAKSLRTRKSKTIGAIVPDITNEFFSRIVLAIENYCGELGYSVFICNSNESEEKELQYFKELELKGVDGLIYLSASDELFQMKTQRIPIVCIDRMPKFHNVAIITSDNFQGGMLAAERLIEKGCKNLLLVRDYRDGFPTIERVRGFEHVLRKHGLEFGEERTIKVEVGITQAKSAVDHYLQTYHKENALKFDGIFATTDWLAFGAKQALEGYGVNIPEQVKIIGYDNISLAQYTSLSSINQDKESLGKLAAERLIQMIEQETDVPSQMLTLPVELVERDSTR
ncbi:LacI family DNA-binding transcriptional regulator [Bacillus horti]|uniref:LacI family transcriptional regulator n=1 Tax=Caldalkalibacillus horti TaxID=77523 RepID=A0ABT9VZ14_9BACI|nr:LacI family DNA-binding transcriptional regulator [Bacillus horti]MDQ0166237.1 LacI family transcriptional regulator [Bacillus horti]